MRLPDFLIVGAAKAGTTSLYHYLRQHPRVFMPEVKEPAFFTHYGRRLVFRDATREAIANEPYKENLEAYARLFRHAPDAVLAGEASTLYLYDADTARRIRRLLPEVKIVVLLRDPAERAHSHFAHLVRDGREPITDFVRALDAEAERIRAGYYPSFHYRSMGLYGQQLERYHACFDRERILVLLHDDLRRDPVAVTQRVQRFLGVDPAFEPDTTLRLNASGRPRNRWLHRFVTRPNALKSAVAAVVPEAVRTRLAVRLQRANMTATLGLDPALRAALVAGYADDRRRLERILGRDLSAWAA